MKNKIVKAPPKNMESINTFQIDLFRTFVANDTKDLSNAVEAWEAIPKYFFTTTLIAKLRGKDGLAKPYRWNYRYNEANFSVVIQPASIEQKDGSYKSFFPSSSEELIEEVLKKIFVEQNYGLHDAKNRESWVSFTISMIYRELKARGREKNRNQIKLSLEIMTRCMITILRDEKVVYDGSILSDVTRATRADYEENSNAQWVARLPSILSLGINNRTYRQYNYGRFMQFDEQLSRWIYKKLVNRFKQASVLTDFNILYSTIKSDSGLLQASNEQNNRKKVLSALENLKEQDVLASYVDEVQKQGSNIIDIKYTVIAAPDFIKEQKAANKRETDHKRLAEG